MQLKIGLKTNDEKYCRICIRVENALTRSNETTKYMLDLIQRLQPVRVKP